MLAAIEGFFWPKVFWDFLTTKFDSIVEPLPILQIVNLILGLFMLAWEWPMSFLAGSSFHRSLESRLAIIPLAALAAILQYQATNAAIYYILGMVVYFVAYSEGEMICTKPWTLPRRGNGLASVERRKRNHTRR